MNMTQGKSESKSKKQGLEFGMSSLEYYTLKDYRDLFVRRKWLIVCTTLVCALGAATLALLLPNVYRASSVILVEPRKVPDSYVTSTVTTGAGDVLEALRRQILSSTRLTEVINSMGLYAKLKGRNAPEEIIETMRKDIDIELFETGSEDKTLRAFKISYKAPTAVQAAEVTSRLTSLFIEENTRTRERQVMGTTEFIDREVSEASKDVAAKEKLLQEFKARYATSLPETQAAHLQALATLQIELRDEVDSASRAQQQKMYLQSTGTTPAAVGAAGGETQGGSALEGQLAQAEVQLDDLRVRYGPGHPDVIKKGLEIKDLQKRLSKARQPTPRGEQAAQATTGKGLNPVADGQVTALEQELQRRQEREKEIKSQISSHQAMLERIPKVEQLLVAFTRDYETARDQLKVVRDRKFSADMSAHLETNQKAERFVILEPVQVPVKPFSPNRLIIDVAGLLGGLAVGVSLVFLREIMDSTIKTEGEISEQLEAPILGEIPWYSTKHQRRSRIQRAIFAGAGNAILALAYVAVVLFTHWYR